MALNSDAGRIKLSY